jgi:ribonuclease PH
MPRIDGRRTTELRPVVITPNCLDFAEGSALIETGKTRVLCTATVEERPPPWMTGQGRGWVTAEYGMLPRSTLTRTPRETTPSGRTQEIRRLIGRSLRAALELTQLGERTITIDCDVLQADGGTRTAAITGGYVALVLALNRLIAQGLVPSRVLRTAVAAVSVGIIGGEPMLDLCYAEDVQAEVDGNVVMTAEGKYVEVQFTAEGSTFSRNQLDRLLDLAAGGIGELLAIQQKALSCQPSAVS